MPTVGVVFDFDDTLVPDSTTALLESRGVNAKKFWKETVGGYLADGFDPTLAWLNPFLDLVGDGQPLGKVSNADLRTFGASLNKRFYPGLPQLFTDLRGTANRLQVGIEFYIVSGGLQEVIEGTSLRSELTAIYGSRLAEDESGVLRRIKRCITFTEKTRYLFEINKGIKPADTAEKPYLVNKDVPETRRHLPFRRMIYLGDGLTDVPCFSLVKKMGGISFGVFDPSKEDSARRAFLDFVKTDRVISVHKPRYRRADELGAMLRAAVANLCSRIRLEEQEAERAGLREGAD